MRVPKAEVGTWTESLQLAAEGNYNALANVEVGGNAGVQVGGNVGAVKIGGKVNL